MNLPIGKDDTGCRERHLMTGRRRRAGGVLSLGIAIHRGLNKVTNEEVNVIEESSIRLD